MQVGHIRRNVRSIVSTSERTSAARASLGSSLNALDGSQDGGAVYADPSRSLRLRAVADKNGLGGKRGERFRIDARYLYGAGKLGGGHGLGRNDASFVTDKLLGGCIARTALGAESSKVSLNPLPRKQRFLLDFEHHHLLSLPRRTWADGLVEVVGGKPRGEHFSPAKIVGHRVGICPTVGVGGLKNGLRKAVLIGRTLRDLVGFFDRDLCVHFVSPLCCLQREYRLTC